MTTLYDVIKERKINPYTNWYGFMQDDTIAFGHKEELRQLSKVVNNVRDAVLFFHKLDLEHAQKHQVHAVDGYSAIDYGLYNTKWPDYLYTCYQKNNDYQDTVYHILIILSGLHYNCDATTVEWIWNMPLTYADVQQLVSYYNVAIRQRYVSLREAIVYVFNGVENAGIDASTKALVNCTFQCIRNAGADHWGHLAELLEDTPPGRYNSINEVQRAHDLHAEQWQDVHEALDNQKMYHYTPELQEIVHKNGFYLPKSSAEFVARGKQHHNCVANYADRHIKFFEDRQTSALTRLLFSAKGTLELQFHVCNNRIYNVVIGQYKGKRNVDIPWHDELVDLVMDFTGKDARLLYVQVEACHD